MHKTWYILKNVRHSVFALLMLLICCSVSFHAAAQDHNGVRKSKVIKYEHGKKYYIHTVKKGQTLYAIAHTYSVEVKDIIIENPNAMNGIKPGDTLKIPFPKPKAERTFTAQDSSKYIFHKVAPKETLYSLSREYHTRIDSIYLLNPQIKNGLKAGQTIIFPAHGKKKPVVQNTNTPNDTTGTHKLGKFVKRADSALVSAFRAIVNTDTSLLKPDSSLLKKRYNVALLLPFNVNLTDTITIDQVFAGNERLPQITKAALAYYEGTLLALDSLKKQGFSCNLYVYDLNEYDSLKDPMDSFLRMPELPSMDLMIGPLYSSRFLKVEKFAKEHHIFITSPVSMENKVLFDNPYASKVTPSVMTQLQEMAAYIAKNYKHANIVVVSDAQNYIADADQFKFMKSRLKQAMAAEGNPDSLRFATYDMDDFDPVQKVLSKTDTNIVIAPSENQPFVTKFINNLNNLQNDYPVVLYGLESWSHFDNLDLEYLDSLHLHITTNSYFDYNNDTTKKFIRLFRKEFKTEPGYYAYQGFDVGLYYLTNLWKYGKGFQVRLPQLKSNGIQTSFDFYQTAPQSGYENKAVYIVEYSDFELIRKH